LRALIKEIKALRALIKEMLANPNAMIMAVLVHVALAGILFVSLEWTDVATPRQAEVNIVEAVVIDEKKIQAELNKLKKAEVRKKKKQRKLDKKARDAEKKRKREERKLAKLRKEQKAEKAKKKKEVERLKAERITEEKRLADIEAKHKQLEDRKRREAETKAMQAAIAAEQAALNKAEQKRLSSLRGQYVADIQNKVARHWIRPASAKQGSSCKVVVNQIPGGEVINVKASKCNGDEVFRRSVESAVYKASPLPRPSDPGLFDREIVFTFKPRNK
jgi:colicin import membrane protein